jgi:hypothetical protein
MQWETRVRRTRIRARSKEPQKTQRRRRENRTNKRKRGTSESFSEVATISLIVWLDSRNPPSPLGKLPVFPSIVAVFVFIVVPALGVGLVVLGLMQKSVSCSTDNTDQLAEVQRLAREWDAALPRDP